jgi:YfiH family protein
VPAEVLRAAPRPWTWLEQTHGADVVVVTRPGEHAGARADAAVTAEPRCTLVVRTADCAPVLLEADGAVGVAHAGWRGLVLGVLGSAVGALRALGADGLQARLGPCIHPCCYEFDGSGRDELAAQIGAEALATTTWGTPAVDLPGAVEAALRGLGVPLVGRSPGCTACGTGWFSHRARQEAERLATATWLEPA